MTTTAMAATGATSKIQPSGRILLAYSGDVLALGSIRALAARPDAEVVTLTLDFGRGRDLEHVRDRALAAGAVRAHVLDVADEFVRAYVLPALKADAFDADGRTLPDALGQPLLARKLVDIAALEESSTIAHEYSGSGPRRLARQRLEAAVRTLDPTLALVAVPANDPPSERRGADLPPGAAFVDIRFDRGEPTALNGISMPLGEIVDSLNMIAGAQGVGRSIPRAVPAFVVLSAAHRELMARIGSPEADAMTRDVTSRYRDIIAKGTWFMPLRSALDAYLDRLQEPANGVVRLKLVDGSCEPDQPGQSPQSPQPATSNQQSAMTPVSLRS